MLNLKIGVFFCFYVEKFKYQFFYFKPCLGIMTRVFLIFICLILIVRAKEFDIACKTHATILRQVEREGFHIDLHSLIELVVDVETALKWENCSIVLKENISNSFYVNPDQLLEISKVNISQAFTADTVDVEAPQHLSVPHTVYVYSRLMKSQNLLFTHLSLPIHLRYHQPKVNGGYNSAIIKPPVLLMNCPNINCKNFLKSKAPCSLYDKKLCTWIRFPFKTNNNNITLDVPVGNLSHLWFVGSVTYSLIFGGCLYIIITVMIIKKQN